jgi:hypothetical protein
MKHTYQLTAEQQAQLVNYALAHLLQNGHPVPAPRGRPKKTNGAPAPKKMKRTWTKAQREAQAKRMMQTWKRLKQTKKVAATT